MQRCLFLLLVFVLGGNLFADRAVRDLIIGEGGQLEMGKAVPGLIDITSNFAFPLLQDANGGIIAACGSSGSGRVVGFTHGGFLKPGAILEQGPGASIVINSIRWAGKSSRPKVAVHPSLEGLVEVFARHKIEARVVPPTEIRNGNVAVYCVIGHEALNADEIAALNGHVKAGGGLVISSTPWAFKKKYDPFSQLPGNQLAKAAGFQYLPDGYARGKTISFGAEPASSLSSSPDMSPSGSSEQKVIERLIADRSSVSISEVQSTFNSARQLTGKRLTAFLEGLLQLNQKVGPIIPSKENPVVPGKDKLVDAIIELETWFNENAPAGTMYAIPAAADYPGEVPADAQRISHTFAMNAVYKGWLEGRNAGGWAAKEMRPTGIYAAPGEVIKVTVPGRIAGEGFEVVIGSYNGNLRNRDQWHRYPDWQVKVPVKSRVTEASSGLGGLVTIRVPREAKYDEIEVTIEGGIRAPLYEHGKTDLRKWAEEVRRYPAPWAELASERMIVAVPSDYIRRLSDPDQVMEIWNGFIDTAADLIQVDRNNYRAERIVFDRQTSAGSMHSSYPVAAHLGGAAEAAVSSSELKKGNWGFFHEYGHNHQHNLWALPGTGETTCNLWSVYIYEEYIGTNRNKTHRAIQPLNRKQRINTYFRNGAPFEKEWSVWTALEAYLMIQEEFGWEPFKKVFDEYNKLDKDDYPRGQQEINDQWVIRLSRACGKNLHPFWAAWNLPMTDKVHRALSGYPAWEDHPVAKYAKAN